MIVNEIFATYLTNRGLFDPLMALKEGQDNAILADDQLLEMAAGLANTYEGILKMIIRERIRPIVQELVANAHPAETIVLRQAMVEVSKILDDVQGYAAEHAARVKLKEQANTETPGTVETAPKIADNGLAETTASA